jgi:cell division protein FtsB
MSPIALLIAIALGAVIGYSLSQRGSRLYWQRLLEQRQAATQAELTAVKQQAQTLRQEIADLRYQLGESEKARRHAENRGNPAS